MDQSNLHTKHSRVRGNRTNVAFQSAQFGRVLKTSTAIMSKTLGIYIHPLLVSLSLCEYSRTSGYITDVVFGTKATSKRSVYEINIGRKTIFFFFGLL